MFRAIALSLSSLFLLSCGDFELPNPFHNPSQAIYPVTCDEAPALWGEGRVFDLCPEGWVFNSTASELKCPSASVWVQERSSWERATFGWAQDGRWVQLHESVHPEDPERRFTLRCFEEGEVPTEMMPE